MSISIPRRVRAFLAGLVVLALTAGAAFAGQPASTPVDGRAVAAERSGLTVPVGGAAPAVGDEEDPDEELDGDAPDGETVGEVEEDEVEEDEVEEDGAHCTDPATLTVEELAEANHGAIVCWAAHEETPDGYDNHGQWVSEWARGDHGSQLKGLGAGKGNGKGKGNSR